MYICSPEKIGKQISIKDRYETDKYRTSPLPLYAGRFRPKWQGARFERNRIGQVHSEEYFGVIPIPGDGEHYSQMNADRTQIIKYSFKTGKPVEVLFDAATARECTFKTFDSYSFAPDGSKLLIATETTPIYRHSYTAVHYIYSLKRNLDGKINNIVEKLSDGGPQQVPVFSPDGNQVAFVRDNNIFLENCSTATAKAR